MMKHNDDTRRLVHTDILIGDISILAGQSTDPLETQTDKFYTNVNPAEQTEKPAMQMGSQTLIELSDKEYGRTCNVKDSNRNT